MSIRCGLLAAALFCAWASPALAQKSAAASSEVKYQQAIRKALEEFAAGHWTEARVFFEDAHSISPNARTLRGLGATSYEARRYVDAISLLEQALASQVRPLTPQMAQETGRLLEEARRFISPVELKVEPSHAEVRLDGELVPSDKRSGLIVDPGEHELTANAPGYESDRRVVLAEGGRRVNVHLVLKQFESTESAKLTPRETVAPPPVAPAPPPLAASAGDQSLAAGVVLGVLGAAGLATGWVFYVLRQPTRIDPSDFSVQRIAVFQDRGYAAVGAVAGGAALFSVSNYFWLPESDGVPVAAWVVGGLGAGLALAGAGIGVLGPGCGIGDTRDICGWYTSDGVFGPMLAMHALPLLTVPLSYALRAWARPSGVDVGLQLTPTMAHGATLTLSGRF